MRPSGLEDTVVDFPLTYYPRVSGAFYAASQRYLANGSYIPNGDYRLLGRTLRTFGDYNDLNDWQWKLSPWFHVESEPELPTTTMPGNVTLTPAPTTAIIPSSTVIPTPICTSGAPILVSLTGYVAENETGYNFYLYSDFLALDKSDQKADITYFGLGTEGRLLIYINGDWKFASVHSNANSLVYVYPAAKISGAWSYLTCEIADETLTCVSGDKDKVYVCGASGLLRNGATVAEDCSLLAFKAEYLPDPCAALETTMSSTSAVLTTGAIVTPM